MFAAVRPCFSRAALTSSGFPPRTALMPVGVTALAAAMARPRSRTRTIACSWDRTPVSAAAVSSPTECPATTPAPAAASASTALTAGSAARPAATIRGCAIAVSLMVSASEVLPWATRSIPAASLNRESRSATPSTSSQGVRKPGVWEPCPGHRMASTVPGCPGTGPGTQSCGHEPSGTRLEESPNGRPSGVPGRPFGEAARGDADLQDEPLPRVGGVPAGDLGRAPQAVPDRVGVDEELPGGGLHRPALVEVGGDGSEQRRVGLRQAPVDPVDQRAPRHDVPAEQALGQQVVGRDRPRRAGPGPRGDDAGERGPGRAPGLGQGRDDRPGDDRAGPEPDGEVPGRGQRIGPVAEDDDHAVAL